MFSDEINLFEAHARDEVKEKKEACKKDLLNTIIEMEESINDASYCPGELKIILDNKLQKLRKLLDLN